ncbi:MAG: hypothetical protein AAGA21_20765 [Pseudomonadota bacterium]
MPISHKTIIGMIAGGLVFASAGLAIALGHDDVTIEDEQRLKLACQRAVSTRAHNGQRNMKVMAYESVSPDVGTATGSFETQFRSGRWTPLSWTCRIHPKSARILRVEFGWTRGGSRLLAAARLGG